MNLSTFSAPPFSLLFDECRPAAIPSEDDDDDDDDDEAPELNLATR